jgi:alpha-L-fucosidase
MVAPPKAFPPVPSATQLAWQENELTVFIHFGMNTFGDPRLGTGMEDPNLFNPTALDCNQWAKTAKDTGFKGMILTAKHHDGFCLWPTATTPHSVKSSSWKNGMGDVVKEFSDAMRAAGLKTGIYCSPWDRNHQTLIDTNPAGYAAMYQQQVTELMSNYGDIFEMWFDGTHAPTTAWADVIDVVRMRQPNAIIKQGPNLMPIREDIRWVGNEQARAPLTSWSVYPPPTQTDAGAAPRIWFPVESDISMIGSWFWDGNPPLPLAKLLDIYYITVGRNSEFLLNVAPDRRGLFSDESVTRLKEFRAALDSIFTTNLAANKKITAANVRGNDPFYGPARMLDDDKTTYWATDDPVTTSSFEVDLGSEQAFNVIRTEEMVSLGQRVSEYKVEVSGTADGGAWQTIVNGTTIGYRKLDRFPKLSASKVRLTITKSLASPVLRGFGVHLDSVSPPESFLPANALK